MTASWVSGHAAVRAAERLGFEPSAAQWRDAVLAILNSVEGRTEAVMQRRLPNRAEEVWHVHIGPVQARVVWSPLSAQIVTVLP